MRLARLLRLLVLLPLLLARCGDLPEPFLGNPGATARRLAVPDSPPMLAVQPSSLALLTAQGDTDFSELLAKQLQDQEIPTLARLPEKTDWRLAVTATQAGDKVVPHYVLLDPSGREEGSIDGPPVTAPGWSAGAPWVLGQAAKDAAPKVFALMMSIRARRDKANPNSLLNRVAKVFVPMVTGAPGDGNVSLTKQFRTQLAQAGPLLQDTPQGADFTVQGHVAVSPLPNGQQQVEISWTVTRPNGAVTGKVSQLNAVPAGSLDSYWGDVALVVAQEAAGGVNTVVERFIGRDEATAAGGGVAGSGGAIGSGATAGGGAGGGSAGSGAAGSGGAAAGGGAIGSGAVAGGGTANGGATGGGTAGGGTAGGGTAGGGTAGGGTAGGGAAGGGTANGGTASSGTAAGGGSAGPIQPAAK
jgi:hypothetical protein